VVARCRTGSQRADTSPTRRRRSSPCAPHITQARPMQRGRACPRFVLPHARKANSARRTSAPRPRTPACRARPTCAVQPAREPRSSSGEMLRSRAQREAGAQGVGPLGPAVALGACRGGVPVVGDAVKADLPAEARVLGPDRMSPRFQIASTAGGRCAPARRRAPQPRRAVSAARTAGPGRCRRRPTAISLQAYPAFAPAADRQELANECSTALSAAPSLA
jgi:hypothetical protein